MKKIYYDKITNKRFSTEAMIKTFKNILYGLENDVFAPLKIDIVEVAIYGEGDIKDHRAMRQYKKQSEDGSK